MPESGQDRTMRAFDHADGLTWLEEALFVPEPFAILDRDGRLRAGITPMRLPDPAEVSRVDRSLIAVAGGASVPLGRFLGAQLAGAMLRATGGGMPGIGTPGLTGAALTPVQLDAMAALGLLRLYTPLSAPARIARLGIDEGQGDRSRQVRPLIDALRFTAEPFEAVRGIAILQPQAEARFERANDSGLRAWLRAREVAILDLDIMRLGTAAIGLGDLIAAMAACRVVVIDDPQHASLLGFCDPGALVVELGVEGWDQPAIAACARGFALDHRVIRAPAPRYPVKARLPVGARRMLSVEIDLAALSDALERGLPIGNA